jgi:hypothetical protein
MVEITWTPKLVEARLEEAADTLRRLPEQRVQACRSGWPQIIREFHDAYGCEPARLRLGPPSAVAIDRMDQTLAWLRWLEPDDARIVWLRACGVRWKPICYRFGVSRDTAWRHWLAAIITIGDHLRGSRQSGPMRQKRMASRAAGPV